MTATWLMRSVGKGRTRLIRTWRATRGSRPFPYEVKYRLWSGFPMSWGACPPCFRALIGQISNTLDPTPAAQRPTLALAPRSFFPYALQASLAYCGINNMGAGSRLYIHATRRESFHSQTHPRLFSPTLTHLPSQCPLLTLRNTIRIPSCLVPRGH